MSGYYRNMRATPPATDRREDHKTQNVGRERGCPLPSWLQEKSCVCGWGPKGMASCAEWFLSLPQMAFPSQKCMVQPSFSLSHFGCFQPLFVCLMQQLSKFSVRLPRNWKQNAFQALGKQAVYQGGEQTVRKTFRLKIITQGAVGFIRCRKKAQAGLLQPAKNHGGIQLHNATCISANQKCLSETWRDAGLYA